MSRRSITKVIVCFLLIISNGCILALAAKDLPIESDHPYSNNEQKTWTIYRPGASQMKLHFEYIRLAPDDYLINYFDKIILSDKYNNELAVYGNLMTSMDGLNLKDFWTGWYSEDTIKVTLVTNGKNFDDGFKIDDVQIIDETDESSENTANTTFTVKETQPNVPGKSENKVLTAIELTSSSYSSTLGQLVTFVAKVNTPSDESREPFGTVTFMDGATPIGVADLISGQATLNISSLSFGAHSVTALYSGDVNFKSSTSPASTITVINSVSEQQLSHETSTPTVTPTPTNSGGEWIWLIVGSLITAFATIIAAFIEKRKKW